MSDMWIARDEDGSLYMYGEKPEKFKKDKAWWADGSYPLSRLDESFFPEVGWEDEEPTEIILKK